MKNFSVPILASVTAFLIALLSSLLFAPWGSNRPERPHFCETAEGGRDVRCTGYFADHPWRAPTTATPSND